VELIQPPTWEHALAASAAHPDALPLAGGTDVMVELNFGRHQVVGGLLRNPSFADYLIPTVLDMPPLRADILDSPSRMPRVASPAPASRRRSPRHRRSPPPCARRPADHSHGCRCAQLTSPV
jgi:hypothetical protein